ncbi:aldo/keto reductase [Maricaulaceae bacterium MS644]
MFKPPSKAGFGVSGAHGSPLVAARDTLRLLMEAFEGGVRVFDTAPAYGAGEAERRLGAAVAALGRDRVFITTKAGLFSSGLSGRRRDFSPDAVEASVLASLDRLGVAGVDMLFLHGAGAHELTPALLDRLDALRRAGAFAHLGAAGRGAELDPVLADPRFQAIMAPVHPFLDDAETARIDRAHLAGKAVFAIETAGDAPPVLRAPRRLSDVYAAARGLKGRLIGAPGRGRVAPTAGLARALRRDGVSCALFTTTRRSHLAESLKVCGLATQD